MEPGSLDSPAQSSFGLALQFSPRTVWWQKFKTQWHKHIISPSSRASSLSLIGFMCSSLLSKYIFFFIPVL